MRLATAAVLALLLVGACKRDMNSSDPGEEAGLAGDACTPASCESLAAQCGAPSDQCGGTLSCGECTSPETCGADNQCGLPCREVKSIFFDLGETLVAGDGNGGFVERPSVESLLASLRSQGLQLGVITTVPSSWSLNDLREVLPRPELLDAFDVVLMSSQSEAPPKPAPAAFIEAVSLLPTPHPMEQSVFVTEELSDIADRIDDPQEGARAAGMIGVHLSTAPADPRADYTLSPDALNTLPTLAATEWQPCTP